MLGRGELTGFEQLVVAAAFAANRAPNDVDADCDRDHQQNDQHHCGEPSARYRGGLLQKPVDEFVNPFAELFSR